MEKIIVTQISQKISKTGVPFWAAKLGDGRSATVWDAGIADTIKANLNVQSEAEIKGNGSFLNIREFKGGETTMTSDNPIIQEIPKQTSFNDDRNDSIVSQCLTKVCFSEDKEHTPIEVLETYQWFLKNLHTPVDEIE